MSATSSSSFALHILTSNEIVSRPDFRTNANRIVAALGEYERKPSASTQSTSKKRLQPERYFHLRVNTLVSGEYLLLAQELTELCDDFGVSLIINERVDIALAAKAHGVQLGRGALSVEEVRESFGEQLKIGVSVHSAAEAARFTHTQSDSGDYSSSVAITTPNWLVAGHVFPTLSHPDHSPLGLSGLSEIVAATHLPVIAIGGLNPNRIPDIRSTGAAGAAVISDVWDSDDPPSVVTRYLSLL